MTPKPIELSTFRQSHWSEEDVKKAELAIEFIENLMNKHDIRYVRERFAGSRYTQHNRAMLDGIEGVLSYMETLLKRFPEFSYEVKNIFVDGDHVILHSHSTMKSKHRGNEKKGFNITDVWRVQDGQLVEHWDTIQPLDSFMRLYYWLTGGSIKNSNGVF